MITIDLTMPIQILNILLLIVIMNAVLYKPIRSVLEERKKRLAGLDKDIETFNRNAELRLEEFEQKIRSARQQAKDEFEAARKTAQGQSGEKLGALRKDVEAGKAEQLAGIKAQFGGALQELKGQVDGFATDIASKVLGRAL